MVNSEVPTRNCYIRGEITKPVGEGIEAIRSCSDRVPRPSAYGKCIDYGCNNPEADGDNFFVFCAPATKIIASLKK